MKVGIIAIAKDENLYLKEWIDYHLGLGFDNIIIGLNDDEFKPQILNPKVRYEDYSGITPVQRKAYTELYMKYRSQFDWLLFIDIDEFLVLESETLKDFLQTFDNEVIRVNEKHYSDGGMLDVVDGDYRVVERFTQPFYTSADTFVKSFVNCKVKLDNRKVKGHGIYDKTMDAVNVLGQRVLNQDQHESPIIHERCWINHYRTKTIGEYVRQKLFRGGANNNPQRYTLDHFWKTNTRTPEKEAYAQMLINDKTN